MISHRTLWAAGLAGALACAPLGAGELQSGIPVGGSVTSYRATKCGGAEDGVKVGQKLCYT